MKIQYFGFAGRQNLGDDAIRDAFATQWPDVRFHEVPVGRKALLRAGLGHWVRAHGAPALLGGGTVIGRALWRSHFDRTEQLFTPPVWEMLGAGVEDPEFVGSRAYTSSAELDRWKEILKRFRKTTVRGPRSAEILAEHGIDAAVVGDPALLLQADTPPAAQREFDLLVNATSGEDQWGGATLDWIPLVAEALKPLVVAGVSVAFVSLEPTDDSWNARIADALDLPAQSLQPTDYMDFFETVGRARVVLGTRLHCNILAAAAATPNISLEYRPKCHDFMASVACEASCHRVDRLDPAGLRADIEDALANWDARRTALSARVEELRARLRSELTSVHASLTDG